MRTCGETRLLKIRSRVGCPNEKNAAASDGRCRGCFVLKVIPLERELACVCEGTDDERGAVGAVESYAKVAVRMGCH